LNYSLPIDIIDNWVELTGRRTDGRTARAHAWAKGHDLGAELGTGQWELAMPTVVVVGVSHGPFRKN